MLWFGVAKGHPERGAVVKYMVVMRGGRVRDRFGSDEDNGYV